MFSRNPVTAYLNKIGKIPLLNAKDEVILSQQIEAGLYAKKHIEGAITSELLDDPSVRPEIVDTIIAEGDEAFYKMYTANLRLVISVVKPSMAKVQSMDLLDLVSEGNFGLFHAVEKFDYAKGYKFSTYATWWIKQAVTKAIANQERIIRVPVHKVEEIYKVAHVRRRLSQTLGELATVEEIAEELEMPVEKVNTLLSHDSSIISLNSATATDSEFEIGDMIADSQAVDPFAAVVEDSRSEVVGELLESLPHQDARIVALRHGLVDGQQYKNSEIAELTGMSPQTVRLRYTKALTKLKLTAEQKCIISQDFLD